MSQLNFRILRVSDKRLVEAMSAAMQSSANKLQSIRLNVSGLANPIIVPAGEIDANQTLNKLLDFDTTLATNITWHFERNVSARVTRNGGEMVDSVDLELSQDQNNTELALPFIAAVRKALNVFTFGESYGPVLNDELAKYYQSREAQLSRLESINAELIKRTDDYRLQLDKRNEDFRSRLAQNLETERESLKEEIKLKAAELDKKEASLYAREQDIDNKNSKHSRREIYQKLNRKFSERSHSFKISKETEALRRPVLLFCFNLLAFFALWILLNLKNAIVPDGMFNQIYFLASHLTPTVGFLTTSVFLIRWWNAWAEEGTAEELRLMRLELDMDRASWLVEMALEWNNESNGELLPKELLDRLSSNMFNEHQPTRRSLHPSEELASVLLNGAAEVELPNVFGAKVKLDRKGITKMEKSVKKVANDTGE